MMDQLSPSGRESASEPILRSRLLPRISFRSMLVVTTLSAIVIAVAYAADQGGTYASAAAVGMAFALTILAGSIAMFLLSWAVSFLPKPAGIALIVTGVVLAVCRVAGISLGALSMLTGTIWLLNFQIVGWFLVLSRIGSEQHLEADNPFAEGQLPPQILAPREPSN